MAARQEVRSAVGGAAVRVRCFVAESAMSAFPRALLIYDHTTTAQDPKDMLKRASPRLFVFATQRRNRRAMLSPTCR